jgi:HipA-like protein
MRVEENDTFGLLVATGADCIGAVEILPESGL